MGGSARVVRHQLTLHVVLGAPTTGVPPFPTLHYSFCFGGHQFPSRCTKRVFRVPFGCRRFFEDHSAAARHRFTRGVCYGALLLQSWSPFPARTLFLGPPVPLSLHQTSFQSNF
jgi:hypothetical protein